MNLGQFNFIYGPLCQLAKINALEELDNPVNIEKYHETKWDELTDSEWDQLTELESRLVRYYMSFYDSIKSKEDRNSYLHQAVGLCFKYHDWKVVTYLLNKGYGQEYLNERSPYNLIANTWKDLYLLNKKLEEELKTNENDGKKTKI